MQRHDMTPQWDRRETRPQPAPGGWAVSVAMAFVLAGMLLGFCWLITFLLKGGPR